MDDASHEQTWHYMNRGWACQFHEPGVQPLDIPYLYYLSLLVLRHRTRARGL